MYAAVAGGGGGSSIMEAGDGADSYKERITNTATGDYDLVTGIGNIGNAFNTVIGKFAKDNINRGYASNTTRDSFVIGSGTCSISTGTATRMNAFIVTQEGAIYGNGAFNTTGADYAECFELDRGQPK